MLAAAKVADLLRRHVLWSGEDVEEIQEWSGGLAVTTPLRHFVVASERTNWLVGTESWLSDLLIATRDDLIIHGQPERFGFLLLGNGGDVYINDTDAFAALGARLPDDMDPIAYAELLVQFHPYSSATRAVLTAPQDLRRLYARDDLPEVSPLRTYQTAHGMTLTFTSSIRYRRPATGALLDLADWTLTVPAAGPARWRSRLAVEGIQLDAT